MSQQTLCLKLLLSTQHVLCCGKSLLSLYIFFLAIKRIFDIKKKAKKQIMSEFIMWMRSNMWMRSSQVVRASGCQCQSRNKPGSISAASDTVESERRQMKQC
jgi:hypothetical protein